MNSKYRLLQESIVLNEARGEYKQYDNEMKYFFPSLYNAMTGTLQRFFPIATDRLKNEEALFNKYVKGINVEIRLSNSPGRNAYTIIGASNVNLAQLIMIPFIGGIVFLITGIITVATSKLFDKVKIRKQKRIEFPANDLTVLMFVSKGMLTSTTPEQRVAIYLHELGHWKHAAPILMGHITELFGPMSPTDIWKLFKKEQAEEGKLSDDIIIKMVKGAILWLYVLYLSRQAEWKADSFTINLGWGKELASALALISYDVRRNVSWMLKLGDALNKFVAQLIDFIDKVVPISSHPSAKRRIELATNPKLKDKVNKFDKVIAGIARKLIS